MKLLSQTTIQPDLPVFFVRQVQEAALVIEFPNLTPPKITAMGTISFQAKINGEFIWCEISFEALQQHFSRNPKVGSDLLQAFKYGRSRIEEAARQHLQENGGHPVLLMAVDFR